VAFTGEGTGMERDWAGEGRIYLADLPDPEGIGTLAAERTLARLGARKPQDRHFPVLYDERVAGTLIGHLLSAVNGMPLRAGRLAAREPWASRCCPPGCR
jgi:PmbA protein